MMGYLDKFGCAESCSPVAQGKVTFFRKEETGTFCFALTFHEEMFTRYFFLIYVPSKTVLHVFP